ncbi:MAG: DUF192 domain-containing protein [Pseudomonadota bacterium]
MAVQLFSLTLNVRRWLGRAGLSVTMAWVFALTLLFVVAACSEPASQTVGDTTKLSIETSGGPVAFDVEFVNTPETRAQGLMFRERLPSGTGMLFDFGGPREVAMWMKNTLIPLDMIFIRDDGVIHRIAANTVPLSLATVASEGPVTGVLEIIGGDAERLGIAPGDRVRHPMFTADQG